LTWPSSNPNFAARTFPAYSAQSHGSSWNDLVFAALASASICFWISPASCFAFASAAGATWPKILSTAAGVPAVSSMSA
jgi:hypothetical protein